MRRTFIAAACVVASAGACTAPGERTITTPYTVPPPTVTPGTVTVSATSLPTGASAIRLRVVATGLSGLTPLGATRVIAQRGLADTADMVLLLPTAALPLFTFRVTDVDAPVQLHVFDATAGRQYGYAAINPATITLSYSRP